MERTEFANSTEFLNTSLTYDTTYQQQVLSMMCIASFLLSVSIISNTFTLVLLCRSDVFTEIESLLYRLLAVEDMLTCCSNLALMITVREEMWELLDYITWFFVFPILYQTIGAVLSINVCRYLAILRPLQYYNFNSNL